MIISIKTLQYCRKIVINWCLKLIHADIHSKPSTWDMKILKCSWNIATKLKLIFLSYPWCEDDAMVYKLQITVINLLKHRTAVCRAEFLTRSILLLLSLLYPPSWSHKYKLKSKPAPRICVKYWTKMCFTYCQFAHRLEWHEVYFSCSFNVQYMSHLDHMT